MSRVNQLASLVRKEAQLARVEMSEKITQEEIAVENAQIFKKNGGGENFAAISCLNDNAPGMLVIWQLVLRELKGWI
jgi:protoheme ferro-lyase